jgi:hypothetical protein
MSNPADIVSVHVKTELQYDVDSQQGAFPSGSVSQLSVTVADSGDQLLSIYYISNGKVYNAHQDAALATAGSTNWSIYDMNFRESLPCPSFYLLTWTLNSDHEQPPFHCSSIVHTQFSQGSHHGCYTRRAYRLLHHCGR